MPIVAVRDLHQHKDGFDAAWWRQASEIGWTSTLVSEDLGGGSLSGFPMQDAVIVAEEMGRLVAPGPFLPVNVVASALSECGSADQQASVLPGLLAGEALASWAFAEPGSTWDAASIGVTLTPTGDDAVVLDGVKAYVEAGAAATWFLVSARTGAGLSQVLVPADAPGVHVTACHSLDLVRRFAEVRFDGVTLPVSAVVGSIGGAAEQIERQLQIALVLQCAESVGAIDRAFEFTLEYMHDRYAFGRPIASFQSLKHRIADTLLALESMKATTDAAAKAIDDGDAQASRLVSVAKAYVGEKAPLIVQEFVQLHGGIGVTWEHDLHLYLRRTTLNRSLYGSPEQHRERLCMLLGV